MKTNIAHYFLGVLVFVFLNFSGEYPGCRLGLAALVMVGMFLIYSRALELLPKIYNKQESIFQQVLLGNITQTLFGFFTSVGIYNAFGDDPIGIRIGDLIAGIVFLLFAVAMYINTNWKLEKRA